MTATAILQEKVESEIVELTRYLAEVRDLAEIMHFSFNIDATDSMSFHEAFQAIIRHENRVQQFTNRITDLLSEYEERETE